MSAPVHAPRTFPFGSMYVAVGLLQILKRVGLAKPVVRLALRQMLPEERRAQAFAGYTPTEHDVFVATFGKSGTNWMMQIAQQISSRGEGEYGHIHDVVPWPDSPIPGLISLSDPGPREQAPTGLRVIKTHLAAEHVPYCEEATYLTIVRDPKEVLVSAYYFLGGILGVLSHLTIDAWFELSMQPGGMMTAWANHTQSFWRWRDRPNTFVASFGDVQRDSRGTIERVAGRMGVSLTEEEIDRVVERSSFTYMKAHESQFNPPRSPFTGKDGGARMIRRGRSGASDELLSRAQQAAIDRLCQAELRRLGSDFPYAEIFEVVTDPSPVGDQALS